MCPTRRNQDEKRERHGGSVDRMRRTRDGGGKRKKKILEFSESQERTKFGRDYLYKWAEKKMSEKLVGKKNGNS